MIYSPKNILQIILVILFSIITHAAWAQIGKVGINTTSPQAMLHVKDSSVLFTGPINVPEPGNPPASGAGTRMMWYPDKAAFRAGKVYGTAWNKDSIGFTSIALGLDTKAKGYVSTAMGYGTTSSGNYSVAMGNQTTASGFSSFAVGQFTTTSGNSDVAMGFGTTASGGFSTAIGHETSSVGNSSVAMGEDTYASGSASTAMGSATKASGYASTAMGYGPIASGTASTAMGFQTTSKSYATVVLGRYNDTTSMSSADWNVNDPLFIIGNGSSDGSRANALTVLKNGKIGVGTTSPGFLLTFPESVGDKISLWGNSGNHYGFGIQGSLLQIHTAGVIDDVAFGYGTSSSFTETLRIKGNGNVGIGLQAPTQKLHVLGNGLFSGTVTASCGILSCSDIRYKKNIEPLTKSLNGVLMLHGIYYQWDQEKFEDKEFNDKRQIGFSAQEIESVFPEMVHTDEHGYKSVDYGKLTPVLVEAIKEQQSQIETQKEQITTLTELVHILINKVKNLENRQDN